MKKLKLFFACLLMAVLSIGQVWATEYELVYTLDCASASSNGSQQAYGVNSTTVMAGSGVTAFINAAAGSTLVSSNATVSGSVYWAKGSGGPSGTPADVLKIGKASGPGSISFTIGGDDDITKVVVTGYVWKNTSSISVNNETAQTYGTTGESHDFLFDGFTATKTISINVTTSAVCVTEIKLFKTKSGGGSDPVAVTGVSLNKASTSIVEGKTETLVATVAPSNASDKSVSWSSDDESVATVDGGIVTAVAAGTATITVTTTDGSFTDECEVTVTEAPAAVNYELVTNVSELADAAEIIIVNVDEDKALSITQASKNRPGVAVTSDNHVIAVGDDVQVITLEASSTNWKFNVGDSKYLYASSSSANELKSAVVGTSGDNGVWSIAIADDGAATILAQGSNTRNFLRYNPNGGSPIFNCYASNSSTGTLVKIFKKVDGTVLPSAELAYADAQKLAKLGAAFTAQDLTNPHSVTVSYASDNTGVATVDPATGAVTIVAAGKAKITASFVGNDDYKAGSASYTIFVAEQAGTNDNPLTEASAKALIDLGCTLSAHVAGVVSSQDGSNFTVTLTNGFKFYKAKDIGNVAFESAYLKINDEVTAYGQLTKYSSTYELAEGCYLTNYVEYTEPLTPIANDKDHPYTVAQALEFAAAPATYDITEAIYIAGVVYKVDNFNSTNGTLNIYVKDAGVENQFEFYKCKGIYDESLTAFTAEDDVQVGDEVIGYGVMKHFTSGTTDIWEFDDTKTGDYLVDLNRPVVAVTGVTVESTASVAIGGHVTLHASVVPATASNKTINWSIESGNAYVTLADGVVTGVAEGTAVIRAASDEDASIYAECTVTVAPLSSWATTYTSNIELSIEGGTSASVAKVKFDGEETEYAAIKAGVSGTAGAVVVNVPAGATALHFHAYSWYSETVELTVTAPAGVTVSPATAIAINQNTGINGNSPFTLEAGSTPQYDAYYAVSLTGNTEPIALTITATSGKRFVLFGVNQEGGIVLESISVGGTATVLEYTDGQHFNPAGLGVTGTYTDASTAPITEGIVWAFDPDPLTEGTTSVSVTATAGGFTSDAFVVNGLTVNGAAPLSPWATTWTSNLDDITGSKVKFYGEETEYAALKAGSSGTAGSATLNIPAQATELHLHAYGWNSEDVTLSITAPAGVTVTPASITLNRNSGFASNSPFTLAEGSTPQTDAYYALSLSGNTDAIELTITATEGKRFLLFGVNQVGGVVPVLQNIEIIGDLTNKSGYKAGDDLNMEGLTVYAYYTLGGDPYTNEDITDKVEWSYDALVEGQTSVTITATYKGQTDDITINDLEPVASADPKIYVSTLNVNFASVEVGESVPAAETVTVTLTNVASVTATLGGTNADAFSVSPASLTESGDITISILANTDAAASYSATLTISDGEGGADDKTVNLSFEVTEPVVTEEYQLVSDVTSLAAGDQIIIVAENAGTYYTLDGSITSQYFPSTAVSISAGIITAPSTSAIILGKDEDNWTMSMGGQLIGATAAKKASLGNGSASNTWTIAIAENVATITNTTTTFGSLQFNYNNGSNSRFLNYTSAQTAVAIYKKVTPEPPTPAYEDVRTGLSAGRYYTICYPKAMTAIKGGTLWSFVGRDADFAYIQQESAPFTAGKPYLIYATAEKLEAVLEGEDAAAAGNYNGLYGTLSYMSNADLTGVGADYLLKNNELHPIGTGAYLDAQRAYIIKNDIPEGAPAHAPGKNIRSMPMHKDATTAIDNAEASDAPRKVMIDGALFIFRGEKLYDATGRMVK